MKFLFISKTKAKQLVFPFVLVAGSLAAVGFAGADREAPVIKTKELTVAYGSIVTASDIKVTDNKTPNNRLKVTIANTNNSLTGVGTYTIPVTATDAANNTAEKTITVHVKDMKAPKLSVASNYKGTGNEKKPIDITAGSTINPLDYVTAKDDVDGDVSPFITASNTLNTSQIGVQKVTYTVDDEAGNTSTKDVYFNVLDNVAPIITQKNNIVDYGSQFDLNAYFEGKDNFSKATLTSDTTINTTQLGVQTINVTATDEAGNKTQGTYNVEVKDITAPTLNLTTTEVKAMVGDSFNALSYVASATDTKDGDLKANVKATSPHMNSIGTQTVTYTVSDAAGNQTQAQLNVIVRNPEIVKAENWRGPRLNRSAGSITGPSGKETYYNLNMSGVVRNMQRRGYNAQYWVRGDGVKMYGDYVMVAANLGLRPYGTIVATSLGAGIVVDTGTFASSNRTQLDIAVAW